MTDNIIKVNFTDDTKPVLETQIEDKRDFRQVQCKHYAVIVSEQHRTGKCKNCGCIVDALLKEEKNTKARLRSARTDLAFIENKKLQHEGKVG
ncbi:hypothetical protein AB7V82_14835 [Providencia stuartii]|uniref:hypothetical protein n=1 Tax=Providencia stuartii TaxID=588 RepID=UPI0034E4E9BF